jgi:hypothetical protein
MQLCEDLLSLYRGQVAVTSEHIIPYAFGFRKIVK